MPDIEVVAQPVEIGGFDTQGQEITEAAQPEGTPPPETADEVIDWKARYEEETKERAKLASDLKATKTGQLKAQEREERLLKAIEDRVNPLTELVKEQLRLSGDTDALERIEKGERDRRVQQTQQTVSQVRASTRAEIERAMKSQGVDTSQTITDPDYLEVARAWNEASETGNVARMHELRAEAYRISYERGGQAAKATPSKKEPAPARTSPTDLGRGAGGVGMKTLATLSKADTSKMTPSELMTYNRDLDAAIRREGVPVN